MDPVHILVEQRGAVGLVTLNRPGALNALSEALLTELMEALQGFDSDEAVHVMVIAGSEKAFAAGADIKEMVDKDARGMTGGSPFAQFERIRGFQKPIVAAVSGWALGGGCELALSCDLIVASETARFGLPEVTIGVIPGAGGTQLLPRALGTRLAMEMILNNRILTAREALELGMVNRVVPPERCLEEALSLAAEIAARAPLAVRLAKRLVRRSQEQPLTAGITEEQLGFFNLFDTEDQKEGMRAFIEKRPPRWQGR